MKAPKILPWIASKAGISEELAINLWRRAAGEAEAMTGGCSSPEYYRLAVERFIDLAEEEGEKGSTLDPLSLGLGVAGFRWMRRYQQRIWQNNLLYAYNACRLWHSSWINAISGHQRTA
jgi:hypothetical protein